MNQTIKEIVDQLESCNYKTEDHLHDLKMNKSFERLQQMAAGNYQPKFFLNEKVVYMGKECFIHGMNVRSQSHPNTEIEYDLSVDCNRQSTTNRYDFKGVNESLIYSVDGYEKKIIQDAKDLLKSKGVKP